LIDGLDLGGKIFLATFFSNLTLFGFCVAQELTYLKKNNLLMAFNSFVLGTIPVVVSVVTFVAYVLFGNELTATKAFTSLTLFGVLRFPLFVVPELIVALANASVSMNRLQQAIIGKHTAGLLSGEKNFPGHNGQRDGDSEKTKTDSDGNAVNIDNVSFSWDDATIGLRDIQLKVPRGQLVAVVGSTGSGSFTCYYFVFLVFFIYLCNLN
jgi:ATP-binding cassette subfamily C (CFTR/MRP) protein 1